MTTTMPDKFDSLFTIDVDEGSKLLKPDNVALLVELRTTDPARFAELWNYFQSAKIKNRTAIMTQMNAYRRDHPQKDVSGFLLSSNGVQRQDVASNYTRALEIVLNADEIPSDLDAAAIANLQMKASDVLGFIPDRYVFEAVVRAARKT
jgi:hypothetical protein